MAYPAPQRCLLGSLFLLWMTASGTAFAQSSGCDPTASDPNPLDSGIQTEPETTSALGLRVFIDPQTGEFVPEPPPGSAPAVDAAAAESRPELVEEIRPDGSVMIRLDDRFQKPLQAEVKNDELVTCHGDQDQHD